MFRLLQTVLFKTDSVFDAQFACFDETINFYQWIKPWKSYITAAIMQKKYELVCNSTYSSDLLSQTNRSHEGFVEFCVIEVFMFWVISYDG